MNENLKIWAALEKTDPAQTKEFSRSGGFKGTAIKPIYSLRRMTEQFGPCGQGWGMTQPVFETVTAGEEILVFCTAGLWHGKPENLLYGVGGDKVSAKRQSGVFNSDEAFKAAYTDALSNCMKMLGVGADVHMGQFDDHKYRDEINQEFRGAESSAAVDIRERRANDIIIQLRDAHDAEELAATWKHLQGDILAMPEEMRTAITKAKDDKKATLTRKAA